jgi:putative transcriptional regulator
MKKKISVEEALIKGLKDAHDYELGKKILKTKARELPEAAPNFSRTEIRRLREIVFGVTQEEFAIILNVAIATVRSWEQGSRKPAEASNRLLQIMKKRGRDILTDLKSA